MRIPIKPNTDKAYCNPFKFTNDLDPVVEMFDATHRNRRFNFIWLFNYGVILEHYRNVNVKQTTQ